MFVDRSVVVSLIDQLVSVEGGSQFRVDDNRPVLVVEGSGGSGRSTFLGAVRKRWSGRTPTASVDPRLLDAPKGGGLRPVLLAILLGLSAEVTGYRLRFLRVVTAFIAMRDPITEEDPDLAAAVMYRRLVAYSDRDQLIGLIGDLVKASLKVAQATDAPYSDVASAVSDVVTPRVLDRLRGTHGISAALGKALEWFRHQDQGLDVPPLKALVHLSRQSAVDSEAVRRDVDDLLIAALLADLRECLIGLENRPCNALILIDNGDMPTARAFTTALVRAQERVPDPLLGQTALPPVPVVVVTSSGGVLAEELDRMNAQAVRWETSEPGRGALPKVQRYGSWLPVQLGDFAEADVRTMAKKHLWPPALGSDTVSFLTQRLTGGHAEATTLVMRALDADPAQMKDLDQVLRGRTFTAGTLEDHLLNKIVGGLRASGTVDHVLRDDLVTLAAARDLAEAESLTELLRAPDQELLLTSSTLWSGRRVPMPPLAEPWSGSPTLSPLVRYLGLRELAGRTSDGAPTWDQVFKALRASASDAADQAGRLHHELALRGQASVIDELVGLLPGMADGAWLALVDEVTSTPDPDRRFSMPVNVPAPPTGHADVIARLVEGQHAANDPRLSDPEVLHYLYGRLSNDFRHLAGNSRVFLKRAEHYTHLAEALA